MFTSNDHEGGAMKSPLKVTALAVLLIINFFLIKHGITRAQEQIHENEVVTNALELNRATLNKYNDLTDVSADWEYLNAPSQYEDYFDAYRSHIEG